MSKVRVAAFSLSVDGFGAGPSQSMDNPLGARGFGLHQWFFPTAAFQQSHGHGGGETGVDNEFAGTSFQNLGAWIIGRNMFGPIRGAWEPHSWNGWWGDDPPYHVPVFVLTHHPRNPLVMNGGTTFYFVTDGPEAALQQAREAAAGKDIRIGGGVETVRQYLKMAAIDELHLAISPVVLGQGEHLFRDIDLPGMGFEVGESKQGERAMHVVLQRHSSDKSDPAIR